MPRPDTPRISILLPAFDAEATLPSCLRSIGRQTEGNWECIVVDDGSSDGTLACARSFARADDRFVVVAREHEGLVATLNGGLGRCRGRHVARMDADDLMHSRRLAEQADLLDRDPTLAAVGCHVRIFPRDGMADGYRAYESWLNGVDSPDAVQREAFVECPVAHPTLVVRRERIPFGGYRDVGWPEDYDLILRLLTTGQKVGVLPRRRLLWRDDPGRLSRTDPAYSIERFTACKASFLSESFLAETDRYILWGYGSTGRNLRRELDRLGKRPDHIVEMHPRRLGNRIHGALVVPPDELRRVPRLPLIVSVAGEGPRELIRAALATLDFEETRDFVCAA